MRYDESCLINCCMEAACPFLPRKARRSASSTRNPPLAHASCREGRPAPHHAVQHSTSGGSLSLRPTNNISMVLNKSRIIITYRREVRVLVLQHSRLLEFTVYLRLNVRRKGQRGGCADAPAGIGDVAVGGGAPRPLDEFGTKLGGGTLARPSDSGGEMADPGGNGGTEPGTRLGGGNGGTPAGGKGGTPGMPILGGGPGKPGGGVLIQNISQHVHVQKLKKYIPWYTNRRERRTTRHAGHTRRCTERRHPSHTQHRNQRCRNRRRCRILYVSGAALCTVAGSTAAGAVSPWPIRALCATRNSSIRT
jgi:hypothetical protein